MTFIFIFKNQWKSEYQKKLVCKQNLHLKKLDTIIEEPPKRYLFFKLDM